MQHQQHAETHRGPAPPQSRGTFCRLLRTGYVQPYPIVATSRTWRICLLHAGTSSPLSQLLCAQRGHVVLRGHGNGEPRQVRTVRIYTCGRCPLREPLCVVRTQLARERCHAAPGDAVPIRRNQPHYNSKGRRGFPSVAALPRMGEARRVLGEGERQGGQHHQRTLKLRHHRPQMEEGRCHRHHFPHAQQHQLSA